MTARPRLLDLFCGAGGAAMGYHRAGFDVVGVDIAPQPHYPFEFLQHDAMELLTDIADYGIQHVLGDTCGPIDAIHASPPCQDHIRGGSHPVHGTSWMLGETRNLLRETGLPWVIENVPGAPMRADYLLCGCLFDLEIPGLGRLARERWFETSWHAFGLRSPCRHSGPAITVTGNGTPAWVRDQLGRNPTAAEYRMLMGIDWMNRRELSQAIPPAYTECIGAQLIDQLATSRAAALDELKPPPLYTTGAER